MSKDIVAEVDSPYLTTLLSVFYWCVVSSFFLQKFFIVKNIPDDFFSKPVNPILKDATAIKWKTLLNQSGPKRSGVFIPYNDMINPLVSMELRANNITLIDIEPVPIL